MRSLILPAFAAAILAGSAAPAMAEVAPSVVVSYKDLNLATPEGRQELETRISAAVNTVCARPTRSSVRAGQQWVECRKVAENEAFSQADQVLAMNDSIQVASAD